MCLFWPTRLHGWVCVDTTPAEGGLAICDEGEFFDFVFPTKAETWHTLLFVYFTHILGHFIHLCGGTTRTEQSRLVPDAPSKPHSTNLGEGYYSDLCTIELEELDF